MQVSLSPEAAEPLKTELVAISITYLNLSMPSWGTNTASPAAYLPISPQPILGHVFLQLNRRAILSNIAFRQKNQVTAPSYIYSNWTEQLNNSILETRAELS